MPQDEPLAAIAMNDNALEIIEWLASDECHELDAAGLIDRLGAKLSKAGMALHRMVFHLRALHPTVVGRAIAWAPGEPVAFLDIEHGQEESSRIQKSPILHVVSTRNWLVLGMDDERWSPHDAASSDSTSPRRV